MSIKKYTFKSFLQFYFHHIRYVHFFVGLEVFISPNMIRNYLFIYFWNKKTATYYYYF
jgi:hypothetical protein